MLSLQTQGGLEIDSIVLYDTLGKKVLERTEVSEALDVAALSPGIYFLHITTTSGIVTQKMIKE
jgi:Secretion system C-terminal sorting domain